MGRRHLLLLSVVTSCIAISLLASKGLAFHYEDLLEENLQKVLPRSKRFSSSFTSYFSFFGPPVTDPTLVLVASSSNEAKIPFQTQDEFTPPKIRDPKIRHEKYAKAVLANTKPSPFFFIDDVPFFDTFDHAKAILGLNSFRRSYGIPFLKLESIRPFFPFFVKD